MAVLVQYANGVPGVKFLLDKQVISIGRSIENDICISDSFVSKFHAVIEIVSNPEELSPISYVLHDLKSTNSTFVNSAKVNKHELAENDRVQIGQYDFRFIDNQNADLDFVKTDTLPQSMMEFISLDVESELASHAEANTERFIANTDNGEAQDIVSDSTISKTDNRFSRRLNLF